MSGSKIGVRRINVHIDKIEITPMRLVHVTVSYPETFEHDVVMCLEPDEPRSLVSGLPISLSGSEPNRLVGIPWITLVAARRTYALIEITSSNDVELLPFLNVRDTIDLKLTWTP